MVKDTFQADAGMIMQVLISVRSEIDKFWMETN